METVGWFLDVLVGKKVGLVGELVLDVFWNAEFRCMASEDKRAVNAMVAEEPTMLPGGIGTLARVVVGLGGAPEVCSATGRDGQWHFNWTLLRRALEACGIGEDGIDSRAALTVNVKHRFVKDHDAGKPQGLFFAGDVMQQEPFADETVKALMASIEMMQAMDIVFADFERGMHTEWFAGAMADFAKRTKRRLYLDTKNKTRTLEWYKRKYRGSVYLIAPNQDEMQAIVGHALLTTGAYLAAARQVRDELGCNVLVKLAADGAILITGDLDTHEIPFAREAEEHTYPAYRDTAIGEAGAGDTLIATVALCRAAGVPLPHACRIGCRAAGVTVGKPASYVVTKEELRQELGEEDNVWIAEVAAAVQPKPAPEVVAAPVDGGSER